MGFNDATLGSQRIGYAQGGVKMELCNICPSNDVSADNLIPTTLTTLLGWVGHACLSAGCVSGHQGSPITTMSVCEGSYLGISVADVSVGTKSANGRLVYIVWGW